VIYTEEVAQYEYHEYGSSREAAGDELDKLRDAFASAEVCGG
jgi:hypothetical protein